MIRGCFWLGMKWLCVRTKTFARNLYTPEYRFANHRMHHARGR